MHQVFLSSVLTSQFICTDTIFHFVLVQYHDVNSNTALLQVACLVYRLGRKTRKIEGCKTIKGPVLEDTIGNHDGDVQQLEDIDVALEKRLSLVGHGDLRVVMLVDEKLETIGSRNKRVIEKFESIDEVVTMGC